MGRLYAILVVIMITAWASAYLREFYTSLANGSGISAAHRQAQLELIRRFDAPYYWAPFQLID